jgi:hypothetical protein
MKKLTIVSILFLVLFCIQTGFSQDKVTSFSGKVLRSDTKAAVADVKIVLLDEKKSDKQDNSVETKTDEKGNFLIENVKPGKYTIIIEATFDREEDVPCQLLMGKIDEPNSSLIVETKNGKKIEHIFIKGFSIKAGKEIKKEYDLVCKSMFGG